MQRESFFFNFSTFHVFFFIFLVILFFQLQVDAIELKVYNLKLLSV